MSMGKLFFSFKGRISRSKYLLASIFSLFATLALVVISFPLTAVGANISENIGIVTILAWVVIAFLYLWSNLAIVIKRCHDIELNGWIGFAIFLIGFYIFAFPFLGFMPGTIGPNRYGADPKWKKGDLLAEFDTQR